MGCLAVCKIFFKPLVVPVLKLLISILSKIIYTFNMDSTILNTLIDIVVYLTKIRCDERISCTLPSSGKAGSEFGALPVATRCWADFSPEVDTSNAFSCSASDTCRVSELNYGNSLNEFGYLVEDGNQVVCDACPLQPGGLVNQFGCDTYTKQCTCNRFVPLNPFALFFFCKKSLFHARTMSGHSQVCVVSWVAPLMHASGWVV